MVQDYASRQNRGRTSPPPSPSKWLLLACIFLTLLGIGWLIKSMLGPMPSFLAELKLGKINIFHPLHDPNKIISPIPTPAEEKPTATTATPTGKSSKVAKNKPTKSPALPAKPKFDFYTLLPQMEMSSTIEPTKKSTSVSTSTTNDKHYVLQIALLQTAVAAQEMIDHLSLLGVEAEIITEQVNGKTLIKVVSKPYPTLEAAQNASRHLQKNQIDNFLIKD